MKIRIITAYRCIKSRQSNNTVYMQQERYYRLKQLSIYPLTAFWEDITKFLSKTLSDEFNIILSIDANENIRDRKLQQAFNSLGLIETTSLFSNEPLLAFHVIGSKQICGVWVSPNILPSTTLILPHYFDIGDHRYLVLDFPIELFLGDRFIPIYKSEVWRLTTK